MFKYLLLSWNNTIRFIFILLVLYVISKLIIKDISKNSEAEISFKTANTLITFKNTEYVYANSVLPACDCWINTGIEIRPGEVLKLKITGKIHTSADKMIDDAKIDTIQRYKWVGPEGSPFIINHEKSDSLREKLLLKKNVNIGAVLLYFQTENNKEPNCDINNQFLPDNVRIYDPKTGFEIKNNTDTTWFLWASVNDIIFREMESSDSKIAFLGHHDSATTMKKSTNWEKLKEKNYNKHWFDDNIGQFYLSAIIKKPFQFWSIE